MSQRLFSFLIVIVMFIGAGLYAAANHLLPPVTDFLANWYVLLAPAVLVFYTLNNWFDVLDSKVADGSLEPGKIMPLLTMTAFYVSMVSCLAGILQTFGLRVLDDNTQASIVNSALILVNVLLRSFTNRTPTNTITKAQITAVQKTQNAEGYIQPPPKK